MDEQSWTEHRLAPPADVEPLGPLPPRPTPKASRAGWYQDPWQLAAWRWWDGDYWTRHLSEVEDHKPRLPAWLSPPILIAAVAVVPFFGIFAVVAPLAIPLGLVPLLIVLPVLCWVDRVEPEPWSARLHALFWGATVAIAVSAVVNEVVTQNVSDVVAAVVSAPLIEEMMKALGVYWAIRRHEVDGVMDGIVYAGWVGLGFAVVEDFSYFAFADEEVLFGTFVVRALMTPFAHPLFTAWTGLALGHAVSSQKPLNTAWWGLALAIITHAAYNGSLQLAGDGSLLVAIIAFVGLFVGAVMVMLRLRIVEQRTFNEWVPYLSQRYGLSAEEVKVFGDWRSIVTARRHVPRSARRDFDRVHAALARLALLHNQPGPPDDETESHLATGLRRARRAVSER